MSHRLACYTLFDITKTGVLNRARPADDIVDVNQWYIDRNTQCNFDTILQIISLRAQPDIETTPKLTYVDFDKNTFFGERFIDNKSHKVWVFEFSVHHSGVFEDGIHPLGYLYKDCENVPMIMTNTIDLSLNSYIQIDDYNRNIYFVKY